MITDLDRIESRLRALASKFTGTAMEGRIAPDDHASWQLLSVAFVNERGEAIDVGDELLSIADDVAMLGLPKVVYES